MKHRFLLTLAVLLAASTIWAADGDIFTAKTVEGVDMKFMVISEEDKTCQVGAGPDDIFAATYNFMHQPHEGDWGWAFYISNETYNKGLAISPSTTGVITIPSEVNGYSVVDICSCALYGCKDLTSLIISEGVRIIGDYAIAQCSGLKSITIPESVTNIGHFAFDGCSGLTKITIPIGVESLGYRAFLGCDSLKDVTILANVTSVYEESFSRCNALTSVTFGDGVTIIGGESIFSYCNSLTDVTIPNSVTTIGKWAFCGCGSLTSITIPSNVTSFGHQAFYNCI